MRAPRRTKASKFLKRHNRREASVIQKFAKSVAVWTWDFSIDGGAVGDYDSNILLPANAVITNVYSDERTAVADADAIKLTANSQDLMTAADLTADTGVQDRSPAAPVKLTAAGNITMNIATNAATAGKITWMVEYYVSE